MYIDNNILFTLMILITFIILENAKIPIDVRPIYKIEAENLL